MKAWKTSLGLGCISLIAGCTFTIDTNVDDEDEIMLGDPFGFDDPGFEPPSAADDEDPSEPSDPTSEPSDPTTEPSEPSMMSMQPVEVFVCDADNAEGECEQCVQTLDRCCPERATCGDNAACETQWQAFKACMEAKNIGDPDSAEAQRAITTAEHVDECRTQVAPNGQSIELELDLDLLLSCIGTPFVEGGDVATGELVDGDGLCTIGCYGVFTLE